MTKRLSSPARPARSARPAGMGDFAYKNGRLYCEKVAIETLADAVGTPFYLYSASTLRKNIDAYKEAFSSLPHIVAYAVKANANGAILRLLANEGGGADIVSEGELHLALRAGINPQKIVFSGVGKTENEMRAAMKAGILLFNVESEPELMALNNAAQSCGTKAPVAFRVNPEVNPKTHPYISTGFKKSKFGIPQSQALSLYKRAARLSHIAVCGIHSHIGSQLTEVKPFVDAARKIFDLITALRKAGLDIRYWNIGGGLGIPYEETERPPTPVDLAKHLLPLLEKSGCTIIMEPGRSIVGAAGALVTRVLYNKKTKAKRFVIVDAGMNDLIRPSLYEAHHAIYPVVATRRKPVKVDVVGPVCESGDFLAKDRMMPDVAPRALLAVMNAGAYGFAMSSHYNARPRPPELLVDGERYFVVRERETFSDFVRGEKIPSFLQ